MVAVDANVLIHAADTTSVHYAATRRWLEEASAGPEILGLPWLTILAFVRITTHPRVFPSPFTLDEALASIDVWLSHPSVTIVDPTARHAAIFAGLLRGARMAGNLTNDAHIAALAIENRARVASFDRDFGRFGVSVIVPGAAAG